MNLSILVNFRYLKDLREREASIEILQILSLLIFLEPQEFATPGTYKKLICEGRPCARCGKCRDWYFTGDAATLTWLRNVTDWSPKGVAWKRWLNDEIYNEFKPRSNKTCVFRDFRHVGVGGYLGVGLGGVLGLVVGCFCYDNSHN